MGEKKGVTETSLEGSEGANYDFCASRIENENLNGKKQDRIASEKDDSMRYEPRIRFSNPHLMRAEIVNGKVIVTAGWRDDDDE